MYKIGHSYLLPRGCNDDDIKQCTKMQVLLQVLLKIFTLGNERTHREKHKPPARYVLTELSRIALGPGGPREASAGAQP